MVNKYDDLINNYITSKNNKNYLSDDDPFNKKIIKKYNNLDDIIKKNDIIDIYNIIDYTTNNINQKKNMVYNIPPSSSQGQSLRSINWGSQIGTTEPNAYIQPTSEEVEVILGAIHMVEQLPREQQRQLVEATREIRYFIDGQVRSIFGATNHFNAIRCLNDPEKTDVDSALSTRGVQLAGEEYFGINRFLNNFPDIADVQWWALYKGGSWHLDTWNPQGEHLDTGVNGWGELMGSVLKVNGNVLAPQEVIGVYRTIKMRQERGFLKAEELRAMQQNLIQIRTNGTLPNDYQAERLNDLGLISDTGALTYVGQSMITPVTALQRKSRQQSEQDTEIRRIIHPLILD